MDDNEIIGLYFARNQNAVYETDRKYGKLCRKVSFGILNCHEDAEECVSDAYLAAWDAIPPERPRYFAGWLTKVTRNLSLMALRRRYAAKTGGGELALVLEELTDLASPIPGPQEVLEGKELARAVSAFLHTLPEGERNLFLGRYYLMTPISDLADKLGYTQSKVKTSLFRTRKKLQEYLKKEELV